MARTPIYAAGGIVVRGGARPRVAVVQRSKDERWVLPRGKLKRNENPLTGARREVVEETGHRVRVHEYLGAITYRASGRPKVVQFWRMQAYERPSRDIMSDILAVEWLPLAAAVRRLSYPLEKLFLQQAGRHLFRHRKRAKPRRKRASRKAAGAARRTRKSRAHAKGGTRRSESSLRRTRIAAAKQATPARVASSHPRVSKSRSMFRRMLGRLGR